MSSLDDLHRTLERQAGRAPDSLGLVEGAYLGAARRRRRHRITATLTAAAAVVALAVGVPVALHRQTAPVPADLPARDPAMMTIVLAPDSGFVITDRLSTTGRQELTVGEEHPTGKYPPQWRVQIYDPGWFDPGTLEPGWPVRIGNRDGRLIGVDDPDVFDELYPGGPPPGLTRPTPSVMPSLPPGAHLSFNSPEVAFETPGGGWVTINGGTLDPRRPLALASALTSIDPVAARGPLALTWLPPGLRVTYAQTFALPQGFPLEKLTVTAADRQPDWKASQQPGPGPAGTDAGLPSPLEIDVGLPTPGWLSDAERLGPATRTVQGFPAWYAIGAPPGSSRGDDQGQLYVKTPTCVISLWITDATQTTEAEMMRIIESARISSCESEAGWEPVVS